MANFIKIGTKRINLAHISEVREFGNGTVRVFWDYAISGDYTDRITAYDDLKGDEAQLLLAILDQDDELVDALYERVNAPKATLA